jgi:hypothetical protein
VFSVELDSARPHGSSARDRMGLKESKKKKKKVPEGTFNHATVCQIGHMVQVSAVYSLGFFFLFLNYNVQFAK